MNKCIWKLIKEQFSINDLDFSDDEEESSNNIFYKYTVDPKEIYTSILNKKNVNHQDIEYLDEYDSIFKCNDNEELEKIVRFYSDHYSSNSLNWIDVSALTNMTFMFYETKYNGDISRWDVSNVVDMRNMFKNSSFNNDISNWNTSKAELMYGMFYYAKFNKDISKWDVSNVEDMSYMFYNNEKFN